MYVSRQAKVADINIAFYAHCYLLIYFICLENIVAGIDVKQKNNISNDFFFVRIIH